MPGMQGVTSVAAAAVNANVLSGSVFEYAPYPALIEFGLCGDAAGELRVTLQSGSDIVLEESPISRQARIPVYPDDYGNSDVVAPGDRIVVRVRNTGAGANNIFFALKITPL